MKILFLCPHGGAKSVIAASYFNRIAAPHTAAAAASQEPYDAVPDAVAAFLRRDGIDVRGFVPHRASEEERRGAERVVDIDEWDDVPMVSEDLEGSVAAIRRRVEALVKELRE